ncbi:hypothetical protein CO230_08610 [Chryseobacterium sp. 6424]|uniref:hypothetical protein n=1 Tax=Chryseobacterium sp. 6424 TaxID=2039166 RepID=UPI000EFDA2B7|nr:hypothetical protein [Chryseobacterium sp. 6424]AYO58175.1 hypothetical protein CO230_08610 [Chryseobacterium sp. 6424]
MKAAVNRVLVVLMWIGLMLFAFYVLKYVIPVAFVIGVFSKFFRSKIGTALDEFAADFRGVTYTLDVLGNVTIFNWLWFLFKQKSGYRFGNVNETISFVLWMNRQSGTLRPPGLLIYRGIELLDRKHFEVFELK